jgi:OOP family OmpA-OmpF porin
MAFAAPREWKMTKALLCCAMLLGLGGTTSALARSPVPSTNAHAARAADAVVPVPKACADLDADADGVDDCTDACPASQAGQAIGPDGCAVPLTIALKGVNFDAAGDGLRADAVAVLEEAIAILGKYPQLRVEVAGHADPTEAHAQALSKRRARVVYAYLAAHGVDAARLAGPHGYGGRRPIAASAFPDGSEDPQGRAKNRRTELKVLD